MQLREATVEDLVEVARTSISRGCSGKQPEVIDYVFALEHDGVVMVVGGIKLITLTTAWMWFDMAKCAEGHILAVYRIIRDWMDELIRLHKLERVMAAVEIDFEKAIRTVEHLGFVLESTMPRFFGNKPGLMYVRLTEGEE